MSTVKNLSHIIAFSNSKFQGNYYNVMSLTGHLLLLIQQYQMTFDDKRSHTDDDNDVRV